MCHSFCILATLYATAFLMLCHIEHPRLLHLNPRFGVEFLIQRPLSIQLIILCVIFPIHNLAIRLLWIGFIRGFVLSLIKTYPSYDCFMLSVVLSMVNTCPAACLLTNKLRYECLSFAFCKSASSLSRRIFNITDFYEVCITNPLPKRHISHR